jgi:hypothetical protein
MADAGADGQGGSMFPEQPKTRRTIQTTLGDLMNAVYEEALLEVGDPALAQAVSVEIVEEFLKKRGG